MASEVTRDDIERAATRISPHVRRTPVLSCGNFISDDFQLILKLEHLQVTGSFKARGAFAVLTNAEVGSAGVVAASGGNFGIAVAHAAQRLRHHAAIFVPETSPKEKVDRIARLGAEVHLTPGFYDEALAESEKYAQVTGSFRAHAYDQAEVLAGQGTVAREIVEQVPDADVILAAVGGAGLIGGIASWCRSEVSVIAAESVRCASFNAALAAGRPVEVEVGGVAASSLGARSVGEHGWLAREWIDESVVVDDATIVDAQRWLWSEFRLAVEPAAAVTIAVLRSAAYRPPSGSRVVALLSGGNVDPSTVI